MKQKSILRLLLLPLASALAACLLLGSVSLIPDRLLYENSRLSAEQLKHMGQWYVLINEDDPSCTLDTYTDQQIIMEAYTLSKANPGAMLLNPRYYTEGEDLPAAFENLINGSAPLNNNYFRYWMGFRVFIRPLLIFTDYYGMLKLVGAALLVLSFFTAAVVGRKKGNLTAICYGLSMALVNPAVVAQSLQFSCCFILAMLFMLAVPAYKNRPHQLPALFCFFGIATQFFDFYTAPLLCLGMPLLFLLTLEPYCARRWRTAACSAASWIYGYAAMWIVKLSLVNLFTGEDGFRNGFDSLAGRLGIKVAEGTEDLYNVGEALRAVWWVSCPGDNEKLFFIFLAALVLLSAMVIYLKKGPGELLSCVAFLAVAALPVLWFMCTAQPTRIHFWFQYRSIAVLFAGIFLFAAQGLAAVKPQRSKPRAEVQSDK